MNKITIKSPIQNENKNKRYDEIFELILDISQLIECEKIKWFKSSNYEKLKIAKKIEKVSSKISLLIHCNDTDGVICVYFYKYHITHKMIKDCFKLKRDENEDLFNKKKKICILKFKKLMEIFLDLIESGKLKNIIK